MAITLASATLELAKLLGNVVEGEATGGSTTTLVDTARTEGSDYFDNGTIWFLSGGNAGKSAIISDWTPDTFTFAAQASAVSSGNQYAATNGDYPRYILRQAINKALQTIGDVPQRDTSLTTVEDQEEYSLPNGVYNVLRVEIATETTNPLAYQTHHNWNEVDGKLVFDTGHVPAEDDYTIRLTYVVSPSSLSEDTNAISDYIHIDRLVWEAAVHALRWRVQRTKDDEPDKVRLLNEAITQASIMANRHPIPFRLVRDPHLAAW